MTVSTKSGISSFILLVAFIVSPFTLGNWPFGWVFGALASVFGWLASRDGSKWWLIIPILIVAFAGLFVSMILHPE